MNNKPCKPSSIKQLMYRAEKIAKLSVGHLADIAHKPVPKTLMHNKGFIGQLIEWHLGASAGSKPLPDFEDLGVELKTIPINSNGIPVETTFICMAQLNNKKPLCWIDSNVKKKISKILWIPVQYDKKISTQDRLIGSPLLWSPTLEEEMIVKNDWEEIMEMISLGEINHLSSHQGDYLQLRPKAANRSIKTTAYDFDGERIDVNPKGFYLRKNFTQTIFSSAPGYKLNFS